jgi:F-type H+-transporting ATPase subunit b
MLIDWFTVGAQVVNFLVLVWLLKRFAYKPILNAIDVREKRIVARQQEADANDTAAKALSAELQKKTAVFDSEIAVLKAKSAADIMQDRELQMTAARQEGDQLRAIERAALLTERRNLGDQVTRMTADAVFASVRKVLTDLGGVSLDERILTVFCERLRNLDAAAKDAFKTALAREPSAAVRSRFVITDDSRHSLQQNVDTAFGTHVPLEFVAASAAVGGIELSAGGQTVSWTVTDYLHSLGHALDAVLDAPSTAVITP